MNEIRKKRIHILVDTLVHFHQAHVDRIRRFVELHPSHQLIEADITLPDIYSILAKAVPGVSDK
jgi:hypothetical protein